MGALKECVHWQVRAIMLLSESGHASVVKQ